MSLNVVYVCEREWVDFSTFTRSQFKQIIKYLPPHTTPSPRGLTSVNPRMRASNTTVRQHTFAFRPVLGCQ